MKLEQVDCILCGKNDTDLVFKVKDRHFFTVEIFNIVRCKNCGLVYLKSRPDREELKKYYPIEYFSGPAQKEKDSLDFKWENRRKEICDFQG